MVAFVHSVHRLRRRGYLGFAVWANLAHLLAAFLRSVDVLTLASKTSISAANSRPISRKGRGLGWGQRTLSRLGLLPPLWRVLIGFGLLWLPSGLSSRLTASWWLLVG